MNEPFLYMRACARRKRTYKQSYYGEKDWGGGLLTRARAHTHTRAHIRTHVLLAADNDDGFDLLIVAYSTNTAVLHDTELYRPCRGDKKKTI